MSLIQSAAAAARQAVRQGAVAGSKVSKPAVAVEAKAAGWGAKGAGIETAVARNAFRHSTYSVADAKAAKQAFKLKTNAEGEAFIGRAILTKTESTLEAKGITPANWDRQDCLYAFVRSPYTKDDVAQALSKWDFLKTPKQAREYIGLKINNKAEFLLEEIGITTSKYDAHEQFGAFKRAGFTQADVEKAKKGWDFLYGVDDRGVKEYLGLKVMNNNTAMLKEVGITLPRR